MGGKSTSTSTQNSTTAPWEPAQGTLQTILGQLNNLFPSVGLNGTQSAAINTIQNNAGTVGQYAPAIQGYTNELLNGGGALDQSGNVNQGYLDYRSMVSPLATNANYNPYSTPGFSDAISTLTNDITSRINGQFAGAGRDFSGYNQKALARGITEGVAPIIASQYNQNVQNQQNAAGNLYGAGNTNAAILSGLQQQALANKGAGVSSVSTGLDAQNAGANAILAAEAQRLGIPLQTLGLMAQIGIPIAALGSQSSGTSNTENQMSGAQQFALIANGIGSLWPKSPVSNFWK